MIELLTLGVGADDETYRALDSLLGARGVALGPMTTDAGDETSVERGVVVIISEESMLDEQFRQSVDRLDRRGAWLMPVSLVAGSARMLQDLVHLSVDLMGLEAVVERIVLTARAGGENLVAWRRLRDRARQWVAAGRPASFVLTPAEVDQATVLLMRPMPELSAMDRVGVQELARHSRTRRRRHRIVQSMLGAAVFVVLAATGAVALAQSRTQHRQADRARAAAGRATASRLMRIARQEAGRDPDLPWLLASVALHNDSSRSVQTSAASLVEQLVPHHTSSLPAQPVGMSMSSSGHAAILAFGGHRIDVLDARTGAVGGTYRPPDGGVSAYALSPDGRELAVSAASDVRIFDVAAHRLGGVIGRGEAKDIEWPSANRLVVLKDAEVDSINPKSGALVVTPVPPASRLLAAASHAGWLVVGGGSVLTMIDRDGSVQGTYPAADVTRIAVVDRDSVVLAQTKGGLLHVPVGDFGRQGPPKAIETRVYSSTVESIANSEDLPAPVCMVDGTIATVDSETSAIVDGFPAHQGPCVAVGVLSDGSWISVGADQRLRHWHPGRLHEDYIGGSAQPIETLGLTSGANDAESSRAMIVAGRGSPLATAIAPTAYSAVVVTRSDGRVQKRVGIGGIDSPGRPSAEVGVGVRFGESESWRWDLMKRVTVTLPTLPNAFLYPLSAISQNGRYVALAGSSAAETIDTASARPTWNECRYDKSDRILSVDLDNAGRATMVFASGVTRHTDRCGGTVRLVPPGVLLTAGRVAQDGTTVVVASDGRLFVGSQGRLSQRGSVSLDLGPVAIDIASDDRYAAMLGNLNTQVVELRSGLVVHDLDASTQYRAITDLAFDDDASNGAVVVRADGSIHHIAFLDSSRVSETLRSEMPRLLTPEESSMFSIGRSR